MSTKVTESLDLRGATLRGLDLRCASVVGELLLGDRNEFGRMVGGEWR